jgi:hypothetical protein
MASILPRWADLTIMESEFDGVERVFFSSDFCRITTPMQLFAISVGRVNHRRKLTWLYAAGLDCELLLIKT